MSRLFFDDTTRPNNWIFNIPENEPLPYVNLITDNYDEGLSTGANDKEISSVAISYTVSDELSLTYGQEESVVFVTIAGRSNALSGFVAANTNKPTIGCPPFADKIDMSINIHSTLQMPSNTPVLTVIDPGNCALAVKRIFGV